ncbi:hypothetical protein M514_01027 [Trichuris suis]|uniref:Uncharacterized protein n=1 Tax=Trichuris suis TaxID=68888 RepID=A0A085NM31_9BILA|nr:hypothetical protein M514_01027 [Trichuris suis]
MDEVTGATDPWFDIDAPMLAETFGTDATGFGDSWFDSSRDQYEHTSLPSLPKSDTEAALQNSEAVSNDRNATSPCTVRKARSYDIITAGNEREFFAKVQADKMPKPIKETSDMGFATLTSPRHLDSYASVHLGASSISSNRKASGLKAKAELHFRSPATGLRITSVKAVTSPKPFNFSKGFSGRELLKQSAIEKKSEVSRSAARSNFNNTFALRQERTVCPKRAKQPSPRQYNSKTEKGTKLQKQQIGVPCRCEVVKPQSVVRIPSPGFHQFRKDREPSARDVNPKSGKENVLEGRLRHADQSKGSFRGVGSHALPSIPRSESARHISKPPLPKGSRQQKANKEAVNSRPPMAKSSVSNSSRPHCVRVTQVKPFSFETEKRHERYLKAKEEQTAAGLTKVERFGFQKQISAPDLKRTTKVRSVTKAASVDRLDKGIQELGGHKNLVVDVKGTSLTAARAGKSSNPVRCCGRMKEVKPFVFETQKRHDQKVAAENKVTKEKDGHLNTRGKSERESSSNRSVPGILNSEFRFFVSLALHRYLSDIHAESTQPRILPLEPKQVMKQRSCHVELRNPSLAKKGAESVKPKMSSSGQRVVNGMKD